MKQVVFGVVLSLFAASALGGCGPSTKTARWNDPTKAGLQGGPCNPDQSCGAGLVCQAKVCQVAAVGGLHGACRAEGACDAGLACKEGFCQNIPRGMAGGACLDGGGCGAGLFCHEERCTTLASASAKDSKVILDSAKIPVGESYVLGKATAPVTIVMFTDLQCPYCERGAKTLAELRGRYGDQLRIVLKHNPLAFHKQALPAALATLAAGEQGKFWEMHDLIVDNRRELSRNRGDIQSFLEELAGTLELDIQKFRQDMHDPRLRGIINADIKLAMSLGVRGTPNFFVNGKRLSGARPAPTFALAIDAELAAFRNTTTPKTFYATRVKSNYQPSKIKIRKKPRPNVRTVLVRKDDPVLGDRKDPLVTIVMFTDLQCPFCARGHNTMKQIIAKYPKNVRLVLKHLPLPFHRQAEDAAAAAIAAGEQKKLWEMVDLIFEHRRQLKEPEIWVTLANQLKLNVKKFERDMGKATTRKRIAEDKALAGKVGARGTPNFFINGVQLVGAQPLQSFVTQIDAQLARAKTLRGKNSKLRGEALYAALIKENLAAVEKTHGPAPRPKPPKQVDPKLLVIGKSPVLGPKNAPITIVTFSDFQCPFCVRGNKHVKTVMAQHPGKIRLVFKHFPLPFHRQAEDAAAAAIAAGNQGKFWEMHDLLFENQRSFRHADMKALTEGYAESLKLDMKRFRADYSATATRDQIKADKALGSKVGVRGTPNFFINGTQLLGAQPPHVFNERIKQVLKGSGSKKTP